MLYMKPELFELLQSDDVSDLRAAVQSAIELEHSTMPPYLYAMYSLGKSNAALYTTLRSIVVEEMQHMLLACNLLNALGGTPRIDDPSFVPTYPTHLPGTVHGSLIVPLKPFSKALLETVFMEIEEPESPLNFPVLGFLETAPPARTIGEFYNRIKKSLQQLEAGGHSPFTGDPSRQVTTDQFDLPVSSQRVTDLPSAVVAIDYIVEQGEGTSESPVFPPGEMAHYYRFAEVAKGRRLIPNPNATSATPRAERFMYGGAAVVIEPGVLPLLENPRSENYASGTPQREASDEFNRLYTQVLKTLQSAFMGKPADLSDAINMMKYDLSAAAQALTEIDVGNNLRGTDL
jgi:hypothetical protein